MSEMRWMHRIFPTSRSWSWRRFLRSPMADILLLRDDMKRSLKKLIWSTTAAAAALGFSSCRNISPTVYGPPPSDVTSPAEESTASNSAPAAESSKAEETSAAAETSAAEETSLPTKYLSQLLMPISFGHLPLPSLLTPAISRHSSWPISCL